MWQKVSAEIVIMLSIELYSLKRIKDLLISFHCFLSSMKQKTMTINYGDLCNNLSFVEQKCDAVKALLIIKEY